MAIHSQTETAAGKIAYKLVPSAGASRKAGKTVYRAAFLSADTVNLKEIAERLAQGRCPYAAQDIVHVMDLVMELAVKLAGQGHRVNLGGTVLLEPSIKGTFERADETFDPSKHTLQVRATAGSIVRKGLKKLKQPPQLTKAPTPLQPSVTETEIENEAVVIHGDHLTYDATVEDEGYFVVMQGLLARLTPLQTPSESTVKLPLTMLQSADTATVIFKTRLGNISRSYPTISPIYLQRLLTTL